MAARGRRRLEGSGRPSGCSRCASINLLYALRPLQINFTPAASGLIMWQRAGSLPALSGRRRSADRQTGRQADGRTDGPTSSWPDLHWDRYEATGHWRIPFTLANVLYCTHDASLFCKNTNISTNFNKAQLQFTVVSIEWCDVTHDSRRFSYCKVFERDHVALICLRPFAVKKGCYFLLNYLKKIILYIIVS